MHCAIPYTRPRFATDHQHPATYNTHNRQSATHSSTLLLTIDCRPAVAERNQTLCQCCRRWIARARQTTVCCCQTRWPNESSTSASLTKQHTNQSQPSAYTRIDGERWRTWAAERFGLVEPHDAATQVVANVIQVWRHGVRSASKVQVVWHIKRFR